ncbi:calmodulin-regulated spectrin-associated protein 1-like [Babylonia areolata]|uniref:calmodulin-regulated spectrin-associated protein 1-like n=1 Tax=Babylonia areolata TaxID=304850 RepID=UPI003FD24E05
MADSSSVEQDDSDVIEIIPAEDYNSQRVCYPAGQCSPWPFSSRSVFFQAKLKASLSWILTKAYGTDIPVQLKNPFYQNSKGQLQVRPQLMNLMTSSELYCQACSNMFSDTAFQWQGHWSIIQVLSRKGIPVLEAGETVVTETVLMHTAPFRVTAHLALIDCLMKAYTSEIASAEMVVQEVRRHITLSASSTLPSSVEEALVLWINKTCAALAVTLDPEVIQGAARRKLETLSRTVPRNSQNTHPRITDLMSDLGDGSCVAATISFYQPDSLPVTDVCLKENMAIADSLYNLRLIQSFCKDCLSPQCFHFTYEDLLYGREDLHENVLVFLAELFALLENLQSKSCIKDAAVEVQTTSTRMQMDDVPTLIELFALGGGAVSTPSHPVRRSSGASGRERKASGRGSDQVSVLRPSSPDRQSISVAKRGCYRSAEEASILGSSPKSRGNSKLVQNVSMSWDTADSAALVLVSNADLNDLETAAVSSVPRTSITCQEQLLPAQLRLSKEKGNQQSKADELGTRATSRGWWQSLG